MILKQQSLKKKYSESDLITPTTRPISKVGRKSTFYFLAITSGIITSLYVILDVIANDMIQDPYLFGFFEMSVGLAASVVLIGILSIPNLKKPKKQHGRHFLLGYSLDPNFTGIRFPKGKIGLYTLLAGLFASGNTIIYFLLISRFEASVIMPFSQFTVVYLLIADSISEREKPVTIEIQSIVMIAIGVIVTSLQSSSSGGTIDPLGLLLVFGPFSICAAFYTFFQKKALTTKDAKGRNYDSINLRLWTMTIMTIGQTIATIPTFIKNGVSELTLNWKTALTPVILSMLLVYIGVVFYSRALTLGKMSIVKSLNSISVVATLPMVALAGIWFGEIFQGEFTDPITVIMKISGSILVLTGIVALSMSEMKTIMLAKTSQGTPINLEDLTKIKGVETVSFITGKQDLLIRLRIRSIGKAYSLIVKNIEKIDWIKDITTLHIMKEYE